MINQDSRIGAPIPRSGLVLGRKAELNVRRYQHQNQNRLYEGDGGIECRPAQSDEPALNRLPLAGSRASAVSADGPATSCLIPRCSHRLAQRRLNSSVPVTSTAIPFPATANNNAAR